MACLKEIYIPPFSDYIPEVVSDLLRTNKNASKLSHDSPPAAIKPSIS